MGTIQMNGRERMLNGFTLTLGYSRMWMAEAALDQKLRTLLRMHKSPRPGARRKQKVFGVHAAFDRTVILLEDIFQVLHGSVPTTAAKCPFLLYVGDGRAINRRQIRIDDARLRMGRTAQCLAK
jgi:hypothetical protein